MIREITGAERANIVGLCLGGTLTAALRAYLAAAGSDRIASTTLLNTLVDFSRPGRLGAFTDRGSVERLEKRMAERGFLEAAEMMGIFTFMRSNDLVWNYAVNNWLMGEDPPAVRHPRLERRQHPHAGEHALLLPALVLPGRTSSPGGTMELAGTRLDLDAIRGDHYVLAAIEDHIAPWEGSYLTTQALPNARRPLRAQLGGAHRRDRQPAEPEGVVPDRPSVTPPDPKAWFEASDQPRGIVVGGLGRVDRRRAPASGSRRPRMGSRKHRPVGDAPGTYVLET